jgi:hypothetical protein
MSAIALTLGSRNKAGTTWVIAAIQFFQKKRFIVHRTPGASCAMVLPGEGCQESRFKILISEPRSDQYKRSESNTRLSL